MKKYTEQVVRIIKRAKRLAKLKKHFYVGTEHLLLALMEEENATAAAILKEASLGKEQLLTLIDKLIVPGEKEEESDYLFTPKAEEVLKNAQVEADFYHKEKVGSEHLLLAIVKEADCVASRLLYTMG
ncbi:MAG TPA: Clp protease N-terminal domain-containing protein, partial [Lachnospiraceae bacterium]